MLPKDSDGFLLNDEVVGLRFRAVNKESPSPAGVSCEPSMLVIFQCLLSLIIQIRKRKGGGEEKNTR